MPIPHAYSTCLFHMPRLPIKVKRYYLGARAAWLFATKKKREGWVLLAGTRPGPAAAQINMSRRGNRCPQQACLYDHALQYYRSHGCILP
jgi:hypothetical protein